MKSLDVLVVSGPEPGPLRRCITSVHRHLAAATVHVWVNGGAATPSVATLAAEFPDVRWTLAPGDLGYAAAVDRLAEATSSDLLLLLPDVELLGPLSATRASLAGAGVAAAAPATLDARARPWDVARRRPTVSRAASARVGLGVRGLPWDDRYARPRYGDVDRLMPGCLFIPRAAWNEIGPFDGRLFYVSGEDLDWQRRAVDTGRRLLLVDEPQVRRHRDARVDAGLPEHRRRELDLAATALGLGVHGDGGRGMRLLGLDLLLRRRRSRPVEGTAHSVVITTPKLGIGGAERQRVLLANELAERGHAVTVVCLRELGHLQRDLHPDVRLLLRPWWQPVVGLPRADAVLVSGTTLPEVTFAAAWSAVTGARQRRRWLVAAHNPPEQGPTYPAAVARLIRRSDGVIALSPRHWQDLTREQYLHSRRWYVPNGVEQHADRGYAPNRPLRVGFLGRIVEHKNPQVLVAALARLHDLDWRLDLFGDGKDLERLRAQVPEAVRDRVHWRGRTDGPGPALAEMDVLCLPSRHEAFPLVLLEAMSCGIPTMATAVCSVPDMLDEGRAGIVVPEATTEAWTAALAPVLSDPEMLTKTARAGWERVQAFYTVAAMTDSYQEVMAEALAGPR